MEAIEGYELKVDTNSWLSEYMNTRGQGHCLTFVQGHLDLSFQTSVAAKPLNQLKPNFM